MKKNKTDKLKIGKVAEKKDYKVEVKYSARAIQDKLIRFTTKEHKDKFEISADDLINILVTQVNQDKLAPTFVDSESVNVVQVRRQIKAVLNKDMKKGDEISIDYVHPYPVEFALIEEAYRIAKIEEKRGVLELTKSFIEDVKKKISPSAEKFVEKFYKGHKQIDLKKR